MSAFKRAGFPGAPKWHTSNNTFSTNEKTRKYNRQIIVIASGVQTLANSHSRGEVADRMRGVTKQTRAAPTIPSQAAGQGQGAFFILTSIEKINTPLRI